MAKTDGSSQKELWSFLKITAEYNSLISNLLDQDFKKPQSLTKILKPGNFLYCQK